MKRSDKDRALEDEWYAPLYRSGGLEMAEHAGWINDHASLDLQKHWLAMTELFHTPIAKCHTSDDGKRQVVLLCTGAFSPVHEGHVALMEQARQGVIAAGHHVVGGFLSASHDQYVSEKYDGAAACHIETRMHKIDLILSTSEWISNSVWEGRMLDRAVNFTEVVKHLELYLKRWLDERIEVWMVFGSDNAAFAHAFAQKGNCVCVERDIQPEHVVTHPDCLYVPPSKYATLSSTKVRKQQSTGGSDDASHWYALRDDLEWATQQWANLSTLPQALNAFRFRLKTAFDEALGAGVECRLIDVKDQEKFLPKEPYINLDLCTPAEHSLRIGRLWHPATDQIKLDHIVTRPQSQSFEEQSAKFPEGSYVLVDDDISTGSTMRWVQKHLPERVHISSTLSLLEGIRREMGSPEKDVCDARDFLLGAKEGGLICLFDGEHGRLPYLWPYVNLSTRAKIPDENVAAFVRRVWEANLEFHQTVGIQSSVGFIEKFMPEGDWTFEKIAQWHLSFL